MSVARAKRSLTTERLTFDRQRSDPNDPNPAEGLIAFPKDFRMVAGIPSNRNYIDTLEQRAVSFVCL